MKGIKIVSLIAIYLLLTQTLYSQVSGISPSSHIFGYSGGSTKFSLYSSSYWGIGSPSWISCSPAYGSGNATITLTCQPNNTGSTRTATLDVGGKSFVVTQGAPVPPPTPTISSTVTQNNGSTTIRWHGTPPSGISWYWQTSSTGKSMNYGSSTHTVNGVGNYTRYLRAYNSSSQLWSTSSASKTFTVISCNPPGSSSNVPVCYNTSKKLQASSAPGETNVTSHKWYKSDGSLINDYYIKEENTQPYATSYTTTFKGNTTLYVSAVCNNSVESNRTQINISVSSPVTPHVSISSVPAAAGGPEGMTLSICQGDEVTLKASPLNQGNNPTYIWRNKSGAQVGTGESYISRTMVNGDEFTVHLTSSAACLTNNNPYAESLPINLNVKNKLHPEVTISAYPSNLICQGDNIEFTAAPDDVSGATVAYKWYVNNSEVGTNNNKFSSENFSGGEKVKCEITVSGTSCIYNTTDISEEIIVSVNTPPAPPSVSDAQNECGWANLTLTAFSLNGSEVDRHNWYTAEGALLQHERIIDENNPQYHITKYSQDIYTTTNFYVTAENECGESAKIEGQAKILHENREDATLTVNPNKIFICAGESITFTAESNGTVQSYTWDLNGRESVVTTTNTFTTNNYQQDDYLSVSAYVQGSDAECTASGNLTAFSGAPITVKYPSVTLDDITSGCQHNLELTTSSRDLEYGPVYTWFIDGNQIDGVTSDSYAPGYDLLPGNHTAYVQVYATGACVNPKTFTSNEIEFEVHESKDFTVEVAAPNMVCSHYPEAGFYVRTVPAFENTTFNWNSSLGSFDDLDGNPQTFVIPNPSGTFTVRCDVGNLPSSCLVGDKFDVVEVTVQPSEPASLDISPDKIFVCRNDNLTFSATSNGKITDYSWELTNTAGQHVESSTEKNFVTNHFKEGYGVSLTAKINSLANTCVIGGNNVFAELSPNIPIDIVPNPNPTLSPSGASVILPGQTIDIQAATGENYIYTWYKDGEPITGANGSSYTADSEGVYSVLIDSRTCKTSTSVSLFLNYIHENLIKIGEITSVDEIPPLTVDEKNVSISYFDGLGRPMQKIEWMASPLKADVVQIIDYDELGLESTKYMPYPVADNDGVYIEQSQAIDGYNAFYGDESRFQDDVIYTIPIKYEASPQNRVLATGNPGEDWQIEGATPHPVRTVYSNNTSSESRWKAEGTSLNHNMIVPANDYPANSLFATTVTNEDGNSATEYKTTQGLLVRKEVGGRSTRYVYDDFGLLRCVIPPAAGKTINDDYCYYYIYDAKHRMIGKKLPGADPVYMVYNEKDQVVLTQDGNMKEKKQWMLSQYDDFGRAIASGIYTDEVDRNRDDVETAYLSNAADFTLETNYEELSRTTYSEYPAGLAPEYEFKNEYNLENGHNLNIKGLVTYSETKIPGTEQWLITVNYYDDEYRVIQTTGQNHLGGIDILHNKYDFIGQLLETKHEHSTSYSSHSISKQFIYDHAGRVKEVWMDIDESGTYELIAENEYNELGQLVTKNIHKTGNDYLLTSSMDYNIRGWLTGMSSVDKDNTPLFDLKLMYNENTINPSNELFSGNISAVEWSSSQFTTKRSFDYDYDELNRIKAAAYAGTGTENYNTSYSYDDNGNITALNRQGMYADNSFGQIDQLVYGYKGNQLIKVNDEAGDYRAQLNGFSDNGLQSNAVATDPATHEYKYDANGNMTADYNKDIEKIEYNHLNLPTEIDLGNNNRLNYQYDIAGSKLKQTMIDGGSINKVTDYVGSFVYEDNNLAYVLTDFGRLLPKTGGGFDYEYFIKDQVGNTRITLKNNAGVAAVMQENHYYPFGLQLSGLSFNNPIQNVTNKLTFQGQEEQDEHDLGWYQFKWRMHSPEIGRFMTIDPIAEDYYYNSTYAFSENKLIDGIEMEGLERWKTVGDKNGVQVSWIPASDHFNHNPSQKRVVETRNNSIVNLWLSYKNSPFYASANLPKSSLDAINPYDEYCKNMDIYLSPEIGSWVRRDPIVKATAAGGVVSMYGVTDLSSGFGYSNVLSGAADFAGQWLANGELGKVNHTSWMLSTVAPWSLAQNGYISGTLPIYNSGFNGFGTPNDIYRSTALEVGFGGVSGAASEFIFSSASRFFKKEAINYWRKGNSVIQAGQPRLDQFTIQTYQQLYVENLYYNYLFMNLSVPFNHGSSFTKNSID
jgi:RHS repeat-associated protein